MASRTITARGAAGKSGLPRPHAMTTTPYRRNRGAPVWVEVVKATHTKGSRHVELTTPEGKTFLVDLRHPIFPIRD